MDSGLNGIYRPPGSNLDGDPGRSPGDWGSVESALRGDFEFDYASIFNDARDLLRGSKRVILVGVLIQATVSFLAQRSIALYLGEPETVPDWVAASVLGMVPSLITAPITAGILLFTIKRAAGDSSASINELFRHYDRFLAIAGLSIAQSMLIGLGLVFFVLPGIYLAIGYGLALPLMIEKQMGIWEALETSRRSLNHCWFRLLGFWLILTIGAGIGIVITLGIGSFWLLPLLFLCVGVTYRNIFGYEGLSQTSGG